MTWELKVEHVLRMVEKPSGECGRRGSPGPGSEITNTETDAKRRAGSPGLAGLVPRMPSAFSSTAVTPYPWFYFPWFQLPTVKWGLKICNEKFQT